MRGPGRTLPARKNDVLAEICRAIVRGGTPGDIVQGCAERLQRYFRTASVGIWFRHGDRLVLEGACLPDEEAAAVLDLIRERWNDVPLDADLPVPRAIRSRSILRWAARDPELAPAVREVLGRIDVGWLVAIPIFVDAEPVGGAAVAMPERDELSAPEELLLEQALGVVGVVHTRAMLKENELRHRERALEAYHLTALGEMATGVAHAVNNPLNSMLHLATMILAEEPAEPVRGWAASLLREARRAGTAMDALRLFARPGTGDTAPVDAAAAMNETLSVMSGSLQRQGVRVRRDFEDGVPPVLVDPDRLRHVLHDLVENARRTMEEDGGGELVLEVRSSGDMVEIGIEDTGPGMSHAQRDAFFRPFSATGPGTSEAGMGLAVAYAMVTEWGGEIIPGNWGHPRVDGGAPGEGGARVTVRLPAAARTLSTGSPSRGEAASGTIAPPPGLSVLVVEDEEPVADALAAYLRRTGSAVEVVGTAEEALERIAGDGDFDVIITDLRMPGMGGEGLVQALRQERPEVLDRVVVTSGDVISPGTARRMEELGLPFLAKPYPLEELAAVMHRVAGPA